MSYSLTVFEGAELSSNVNDEAKFSVIKLSDAFNGKAAKQSAETAQIGLNIASKLQKYYNMLHL